jgi:hypothetical protein
VAQAFPRSSGLIPEMGKARGLLCSRQRGSDGQKVHFASFCRWLRHASPGRPTRAPDLICLAARQGGQRWSEIR